MQLQLFSFKTIHVLKFLISKCFMVHDQRKANTTIFYNLIPMQELITMWAYGCKLREIYCIISLTCGKTHLSNFASTQKTSLTINEENLRCFISLLLTLCVRTSSCCTWCGLETHHLACKPLLSNITYNHHRSIPNPISNAHGYICTQGIVYPMLCIFNS